MNGYRVAAKKETRQQTFRARFVRRDVLALVATVMAIALGVALAMPPKTEVHCLQLARTCTVDRVFLGAITVHDLMDLRGALGPARVEGSGKQRHVVVQMEGGGDRDLGNFGAERDLLVRAITAFCLTQRDTDASHDGTVPLVVLLVGFVASVGIGIGFARERLDVTLASDGDRLQVSVARSWRRRRTLDFDLHELTAFQGHVETRRSGRRGTTVHYRLEAQLPRQREEVLPEQLDHPALHALTAQLNHFLAALPGGATGSPADRRPERDQGSCVSLQAVRAPLAGQSRLVRYGRGVQPILPFGAGWSLNRGCGPSPRPSRSCCRFQEGGGWAPTGRRRC